MLLFAYASRALIKMSATLLPVYAENADVDVDVEWMYELRQSPLCPPRTYDLHSNDTIKFLVYYSNADRLPVLLQDTNQQCGT